MPGERAIDGVGTVPPRVAGTRPSFGSRVRKTVRTSLNSDSLSCDSLSYSVRLRSSYLCRVADGMIGLLAIAAFSKALTPHQHASGQGHAPSYTKQVQ